jgi:hypothetical protein
MIIHLQRTGHEYLSLLSCSNGNFKIGCGCGVVQPAVMFHTIWHDFIKSLKYFLSLVVDVLISSGA